MPTAAAAATVHVCKNQEELFSSLWKSYAFDPICQKGESETHHLNVTINYLYCLWAGGLISGCEARSHPAG